MNTAGFEWQKRLAPGSPDRESALRELRLIMLKGVRAGLFRRPGTDDDFLEDVVQSAMIRVLDHLDRFEGRSAFTTWAMGTHGPGDKRRPSSARYPQISQEAPDTTGGRNPS